jgi:hypothetical protein
MIIDINILKRLGKRFGVFPISSGPLPLQAALQKPEVIFIKAPAGIEPSFTGGGYQWSDELNGYILGNQKLFLTPDGTTVWTFKDILFRGLSLDSVQKWVSGDAEYPNGKANAFFVVYGKLTGQDLAGGENAGDNVPDGEQEPDEGGGLATADDENAPPFSKQDIQKMLKGEFPADIPTGPKASMDTAIPDEPSSPMSGPPPSRLGKGNPLATSGSEADNIIKTLYKQAKVNPNSKLSKQNPIRLDSDAILDLYQRTKQMAPEEGKKLMAFLKSGAILPLEEGMIAKHQLNSLMEHIVNGIVDEVEKAKKKTKSKKKEAKPKPEDPDKGGGSGDPFVGDWTRECPDEGKKNRLPGRKVPGGYDDSPEHSQMDWEPSAETPPFRYGEDPEKPDYKRWLIQVANKLWKDPMDIWSGEAGSRASWRVTKVTPHETGEYYQLGKEKTVKLTRSFVRRNNKWYYLNPDPHNRHWVELGKEHPMDEPSIEQEAALDEMTTTSGGGGSSAGTTGYNIPGAFGRKMSHRKDHIEVLGYKMTPEGEKEYKRPADKLYEAIKSQVKKLVKEGNFDGLRSPYIPGGVEPLQQEDSGLGSDFDRAQQHSDTHFFDALPEDVIEIKCPQCGEMGHIKDKGSKGSSWWWKAECPHCKHKWEDENV